MKETTKATIKVMVIMNLWLLSLWCAVKYFSPYARDARRYEEKNKVLRLMAEQRELQFKIRQLEARMNPRPKEEQE